MREANGVAQTLRRMARPVVHGIVGRLHGMGLARTQPTSLKRVLISGYTGLGHFVMKTVLIRQIQELYPGCAVTIIAGNPFGTEHVLGGYRTVILQENSS